MPRELSEGMRLMVWASGNTSTLHIENDNCDEPLGIGKTRCKPSGYVLKREELESVEDHH